MKDRTFHILSNVPFILADLILDVPASRNSSATLTYMNLSQLPFFSSSTIMSDLNCTFVPREANTDAGVAGAGVSLISVFQNAR
jgi:hypothetical protein